MKTLKLIVLVLTIWLIESSNKRQRQIHSQRKLKARKRQETGGATPPADGGATPPADGGAGAGAGAGAGGDKPPILPPTGPIDTSVVDPMRIPPLNMGWQQGMNQNYLLPPPPNQHRIPVPMSIGLPTQMGGFPSPSHPMLSFGGRTSAPKNSFLQAVKKIKERESKLRQIEYIQNKERELDLREQRVKDRLTGTNPMDELALEMPQSYPYKKLKKRVNETTRTTAKKRNIEFVKYKSKKH